MTSAELFTLLAEATIATSAALLLVLILRRPLRRVFGVAIAYALWGLVPVALVAVSLPAPTAAIMRESSATIASIADVAALASSTSASIDDMTWFCAAWLLGVAIVALGFSAQQLTFLRTIGPLRVRDDGLKQAANVAAGLPAALGFWRPIIVVPADYDTRYSPEERRMMRAHERAHIRHGDLQLNALVVLLRSVFWFNPLVHVAARHFRHDQELACDQRVVACHPQSRRAYGEAMVKTQLATQPLPLGCHWGYSHPLKERIEMLKQPVPTLSRWIGGSAIVVALTSAIGVTAWAAQPRVLDVPGMSMPAGSIKAQISVRIDDGKPETFTIVNPAGSPFSVRTEMHGQVWDMHATATPRDDGMIEFAATWRKDGKVLATPSLIVKPGMAGGVSVGQREAGGGFNGIEMDIVLVAAPIRTGEPSIDVSPADDTQIEMDSAPVVLEQGRVPPAYPAPAVAGRQEGMVMLLVDVSADGKPTAITVERSQPVGVFDAAAVEAVWKWKFEPQRVNGRAVAGRTRVPLRFELPAPAPVNNG